MKKLILTLILTTCIFQNNFAQTVCLSEQKDDYEDLNEIIANKCEVNHFKITTPKKSSKKRYHIKRKNGKNKEVNQLKRIRVNNINTSFNTIKINEVKNNIENIALSLNKTEKNISFLEVENTPLFASDYKKGQNSFDKKMMTHIQNNFKYPKKALIDKVEGRVFISFIINKNGDIELIKATSDIDGNEILKQEAIRIISLLPKFIPGKQGETKVNVSYIFHMDFSLR